MNNLDRSDSDKGDHDSLACFFEKNPTFNWLANRRRLRGCQVLLVLPACWAIAFIACCMDNALFSVHIAGARSFRGLYADVYMYALMVVLAIIVFVTRRLQSRVLDLRSQYPDMLQDQTEETRARSLKAYDKAISFISLRDDDGRAKRWHMLCLCLCGFCVFIFQIVVPFCSASDRTSWSMDPKVHPFAYLCGLLWAAFFMVIIVGNIVWYVLATGFQIFKIVRTDACEERLRVIPNAPDGHGGILAVGKVAFGMATVVGCGMPLVFIWIMLYGADAAGLSGATAYSMFVTLVFFLPLLSTHRAMKNAKRKELRRASRLFQQEYQLLPDGTKPASETKLTERLDLMEKLDGLYSTIKTMPVWPFDSATLTKYFLFVLTPLLSVVLRIWLVPVVSAWLNRNGQVSILEFFRSLSEEITNK